MIGKFISVSIVICVLLNYVAKCSANECLEDWERTGKLILDCDRKFLNCANETAQKENATAVVVYTQCDELNKFPSEIFGAFQSMKRLEVSHPHHLTKEDFLGANQLEFLTLFSGKLNLSASTFVNAPKLKAIIIEYTDVTYIDPQAFHGENELRSLVLSITSNATLPEGLFDGLPKLQLLSLLECACQPEPTLSSLDNTIDFETLRFPADNNIKFFRFVSGNITELKGEMFVNFTQLTMLFLMLNRIESVRPYTFTRMNQLILLDLSENQIEEITQAMLAGLTNLRTADFSDNRIRHIESEAFSSTPQLRRLEIFGNEMVTLEPHTLLKIRHLKLTGNYESTVDLSLFCNLPSLSYLILRGKRISKLKKCTQNGNSGTPIDLASEEVLYNTTQTEELLSDWQGLDNGSPTFSMGMKTHIDLAYIDGISDESLFWELSDEPRNTSTSGNRLALLDLGGNRLSDWEDNLFDNFVNLKVLDLEQNLIVSLRSGQFNGLGNLLILNLSHCGLSSLHFNVFSSLTNLKKLYLLHNEIRTLTPPEMSMNRLTVLEISVHYFSIDTFSSDEFRNKFNWSKLRLGVYGFN